MSKCSFQILGNEWKAWKASKEQSVKAKVSDAESDEDENDCHK